MKNIFWSLLIIVAGACTDKNPDASANVDESTDVDATTENRQENTPPSVMLKVKNGELTPVPEYNLNVSVQNVNDSRCPADATCITGGDVVTDVTVSIMDNPGEKASFTLCSGDCVDKNDSIHFALNKQNYMLFLKDVTPFPFASDPSTQTGKTAEFVLERIK